MSAETSQFEILGLNAPLLKAIADTGYLEPTPIQSKAIPIVLEGHDLLAAAQTGTGKTAGFTLPVLQLLSEQAANKKPGSPRCLIITPTRELAAQIAESVNVYSKYLPLKSLVVFGGVNINPQIYAMRKPIDILIATPGRLLDLAGQNLVNLNNVNTLVLDEADRMLDMGFIHDIKRLLRIIPEKRQTLLFSATFSNEIRALARKLLKEPVETSVAAKNTASELVEQSVHLVDKARKRALLSKLIDENQWNQVLVFTKTKHGANRLAEQLDKDGIESMAIHGNKSQGARTRALAKFKAGTLRVLVATDIAARGLDIEQLPHVVNYELPHVAEDYVHRIGRTGRAGMTGTAVSLVHIDELKLLKGIEKLIGKTIPVVEIESFTGHTEKPGSNIVEQKPNQRRRNSPRSASSNDPNKRQKGRNSSRPADKNGNRASGGAQHQKSRRRNTP